jgi:multiple sugar transport system substrate-binding protein
LKEHIDTENVIFGALIAMFVVITLVMGSILYSAPHYPREKTLTVLIPAGDDLIQAQRKFTEGYKKVRPDIRVETVMFSDQNVWQKLEFMMVAGIPPDVSNIEQPNLPRFIYLDALEPLDGWMKDDPAFDPAEIFPQCLDEGNWNNTQYAIPTQVSTVLIWYNKDIFDEARVPYPSRDWTLDDLVAAARRLTKDVNGDGRPEQYGLFTAQTWWNRYPAWIWMRGGEFLADDQMTSTFDDPRVVAGVQWLADLVLKHRVMPSSTVLSSMSALNMFMTGRLAMTTQTRFFIAHFYEGKNADKIRSFEVDVAELPHDEKRATTFMVEQYIIPKMIAPERKKMAWDYIKFLTSDAGQEAIADLNIALPVKRAVAERMVVHPGKPPANDRAFIDSIEYGRYFYRPMPSEADFQQATGDLSAVYSGEMRAEDACRRITVISNQAMENFFRSHPGARVPMHTRFAAFDRREGGRAAAAGAGQEDAAGAGKENSGQTGLEHAAALR